MYRNFYSINDMPKPIKHEESCEKEKEIIKKDCKDLETSCNKKGGFFDNLQLDDIILIAIILLLLADGCDDNLLILAIAFVFISGI